MDCSKDEQLWECLTCAFMNLPAEPSCEICHDTKSSKQNSQQQYDTNEPTMMPSTGQTNDAKCEISGSSLMTWADEEELPGSNAALNIEEIVDHIFSFLSFADVLLPFVSRVCRRWRRLALAHIRPLPTFKQTCSPQRVEAVNYHLLLESLLIFFYPDAPHHESFWHNFQDKES